MRPDRYQSISGNGDILSFPVPIEPKKSTEEHTDTKTTASDKISGEPKKSDTTSTKPKEPVTETVKVVKEEKTMETKKRFPWGWLFAILIIFIIVILSIVLVPHVIDYIKSQTAANQYAIQQFAQSVDNKDQQIHNLELKMAQLEGNATALAQQNQDLAIAVQQAEAQAAALAQQNQNQTVPQQSADPVFQQTPVQPNQQVPTEAVIYAQYKGVMTNFGIYFDRANPIGERITYTNRNLLVPDKAWNDPLTQVELRLVETTWVPIEVDLPQGASLVIFAGGLKQDGKIISNNGIYLDTKTAGFYRNLEIRNGEAVIWFNDQNKAADWERIKTQVQNGNFDIRHDLQLTDIYK